MILFDLLSPKRQTETIPPLMQSISRAYNEWKWAREMFKTMPADHELVDYSAHMILATERRYMYLLRKARQEGLQCSTYQFEEF